MLFGDNIMAKYAYLNADGEVVSCSSVVREITVQKFVDLSVTTMKNF